MTKTKISKTLSMIGLWLISFASAYAFTPETVNCDTPSQMFGSTQCTDSDGNVKICKHTFWITHSCQNYYGDTVETELAP